MTTTVIPIEEWHSPLTLRESLAAQPDSTEEAAPKRNLLPIKVVLLAVCLLVFLAWIGLIVLLIVVEEWQLVMVAWLLLYAAAHFSYWYCKRLLRTDERNLTLRQRMLARLHGEEARYSSAEANTPGDQPPSYEELVKAEIPPPAYYMVVRETPRFKRLFGSLPWFLRKKTLEQQQPTASTVSCKTVDVSKMEAAPTSCCSSGEYNYQDDELWKASGGGGPRSDSIVVANISLTTLTDDDTNPELPSYEQLIREGMMREPVLTPIHRALASLPTTLPSVPEAEPSD